MRTFLFPGVVIALLSAAALAQSAGTSSSRMLLNQAQAEKLHACEAAAGKLRAQAQALRNACRPPACDFGKLAEAVRELRADVAALGRQHEEMLAALDAAQRERARSSIEAVERQQAQLQRQMDAVAAELRISKPQRVSVTNALAGMEKSLQRWSSAYHEMRDLLE